MLPEQQCNTTVCQAPCEGAAPPTFCPPDMPECHSGCACFLDCSTDTLTCFMTKHCMKRRRLFTNRRHARAAIQDEDLSLSTVAQTPPPSNVAQTKKQSSKQNLTTFTDIHGESEKQDSLALTVTQNTSGRAKKVLSPSSASQTSIGREDRNLTSSTDEAIPTQAISQSAGNDIASSVVQSVGGRVERQLSESTLTATATPNASSIEYATFRAQKDPITMANPVSIDYKRLEKEAEKAAEAKVKKAAEKSAEKAVEVKGTMIKKSKIITTSGAGVVAADVAAVFVVLFAWIYKCLASVLPGNP